MPRFICHHDGKFFEWSTVVDAPVTYAMTEAGFTDYWRERWGSEGVKALPERLSRARQHGTSSISPMSLDDLISGNRAGDGEKEATLSEILASVGLSDKLKDVRHEG